MAKLCFCGCGQPRPSGLRKKAANSYGRLVARDVALFRGALERDENDAETVVELQTLVRDGEVYRDDVRDVVHGLRKRMESDKDVRSKWSDLAAVHRKRLLTEISAAGYPGLNAANDADLVYAGAVAPARLLAVEATGTTLNDDPKVILRLRVEPPGAPSFEVERKLFISRVELPLVGERVTVHYDPEDHERFTFRRDDLVDDRRHPPEPAPAAPPDRLAQLEALARLHANGTLTDAELETEKQRILNG
jgi:hypothetical protein